MKIPNHVYHFERSESLLPFIPCFWWKYISFSHPKKHLSLLIFVRELTTPWRDISTAISSFFLTFGIDELFHQTLLSFMDPRPSFYVISWGWYFNHFIAFFNIFIKICVKYVDVNCLHTSLINYSAL